MNTTIVVESDIDHGLPVSCASLGWWLPSDARSSLPAGQLLFGYETPAFAIRPTGHVAYSGYTSGLAFASIDWRFVRAWPDGKASLVADLASGKVTGALTGACCRSME